MQKNFKNSYNLNPELFLYKTIDFISKDNTVFSFFPIDGATKTIEEITLHLFPITVAINYDIGQKMVLNHGLKHQDN